MAQAPIVDGMQPTTHMTHTAADRINAFIFEAHCRGYEIERTAVTCDGNTVTADGTTVWMVTEDEVKAAGLSSVFADADQFTFNGVSWLTFPA